MSDIKNKPKKDKQSKKMTIIKLVFSCIIIGLLIGLAVWGFIALGFKDLTPEEVQEYIKSTGAVAPLVYITISFLQVTFIPLPATVVIVPGCYLFGPWLCFIYSYIGVIAGSLLAFLLGKLIGRPFINWIAGDKETVENFLKRMEGKEKVVLFFMFLFPLFPDDLLCSIAGIMPISWCWFIIVQFITRISSIAGTILTFSGVVFPYDTWWGITIIVVLCILGLIAFIMSFKYADKINAWFDNFTTKISNKLKRKSKASEVSEINEVTEETNEVTCNKEPDKENKED